MDCPDFQIFLIVRFLAMEDQVNRQDCLLDIRLAVPVVLVPVPVLFPVHKNPESNMQMLTREKGKGILLDLVSIVSAYGTAGFWL
jgi:hypothetical protein